MKLHPVPIPVLVVLQAGCTTTFSGGFPTDTSTDDPGDTTGDGTTEPAPDGPPPCDRNGHENFYDSAEAVDGEQLLYISDANDPGGTEPFYSLLIQMFYGYGDPPPLDAPGTYELATTDVERNLGTCGTCVYIRDECNPLTGECTKYFFQTGGVLQIDAIGVVGEIFEGSLIGVTLEEVAVDFTDWTSTPVEGGEGWCIEHYGFSREITPLP